MLIREYRRLRDKGYPAMRAIRDARIRASFDKLESDGFVRLEIRPDMFASLEDLSGDTFNREANPNIQESRTAREEKEFRDEVERDGVWGCVGEYRTHTDGLWITADSVWGFVGHAWHDSGYDYDIMQATMDELERARARLCPTCGR